MLNSINDALEFMRSGTTSDIVADAVAKVGEKNVRVILTELFGWMKRQRKFNHEKPLELRSEFTWCQCLASFLESELAFNRLLKIDDNQVAYRDDVTQETRAQIRELVAEGYQPVLRPLKV